MEYETNLRSGLPANASNSIEAVEGVNHLFQHCTTGAHTEYRDIEETLAPEVLEKLTQWVQQVMPVRR